jgi:hypothetical protein
LLFTQKKLVKNGKHAAVPAISNIAAISYVSFQVFQRIHQHIFHPMMSATVHFGTNHYQFLPSTLLLCLLSTSPQVKNNNVEIQTDDLQTFDALERDVKKLEAATKLFSKRGKGRVAQELMTLSEDNNT